MSLHGGARPRLRDVPKDVPTNAPTNASNSTESWTDQGQAGVQRSLRELDEESWDAYKRSLRIAERQAAHEVADPDEDPRTQMGRFRHTDAGHPLGRGMPRGRSLREDGESHREAWMRLIRLDPCAYCGRRPASTIDHIIPSSKARPGEGHNWLNYTAACEPCNRSKEDMPLLVYLRLRVRKAARQRARVEAQRRGLAGAEAQDFEDRAVA